MRTRGQQDAYCEEEGPGRELELGDAGDQRGAGPLTVRSQENPPAQARMMKTCAARYVKRYQGLKEFFGNLGLNTAQTIVKP